MGVYGSVYGGGGGTGSEVYPTTAQVLAAVDFGPTGADYTGTVVLPAVGSVEDGVFYGPSSSLEGTLDVTGGLTAQNISDIADATAVKVLTVSANIPETQAGINVGYTHSTWTQRFEDLPDLTGYDDIVFVLKRDKYHPDTRALLKVNESEGLKVLAGSSSGLTVSDASITVVQESPTGIVDLVVASNVMASIPVGIWSDGMKKLDVGDDEILRDGTTAIRDSVVDETS